jgi:hypothetical protein
MRKIAHANLALKCYLETRQVGNAERIIDQCLAEDGNSPSVLLQRASILGLQARCPSAMRRTARLAQPSSNSDFGAIARTGRKSSKATPSRQSQCTLTVCRL